MNMNTLHGWDGYPPDRQREGWHWLRFGELMPAYWSAAEQTWSQGGLFCGGGGAPELLTGEHWVGGVEYVAPCVMPDSADAG